MKYQKKYLLMLATKLVEKVLDSSYAKEYYKLFLKNKNKKLVFEVNGADKGSTSLLYSETKKKDKKDFKK